MFNSQRVDPAKYGGWEEVLFGDNRYENNPNTYLLAFRAFIDAWPNGRNEAFEAAYRILGSNPVSVPQLQHARKVVNRLVAYEIVRDGGV